MENKAVINNMTKTNPSFLYWFVLPLFVMVSISYYFGYKYYKDNKNGIPYIFVDRDCLNDMKKDCRQTYTGIERNECIADAKLNCPEHETITSKTTPLLLYIIVPFVLALIFSNFTYKLGFLL